MARLFGPNVNVWPAAEWVDCSFLYQLRRVV